MPRHARYLAALDAGHTSGCAIRFAVGPDLSPMRLCHCRGQQKRTWQWAEVGTPLPPSWEPTSFGEVLKARRHEKGWSVGKLARLSGVSKGALFAYEGDHRTPPPAFRVALRSVLGLGEDDDEGWWGVSW